MHSKTQGAATPFSVNTVVFYLKVLNYVNPIPAGGGGNLTPRSFFTLLKMYWSEAVEIFWLFLHTQSPPFKPKTGL